MVMGPNRTQKQDLSWVGPAAIYWTGLDWTGLDQSKSEVVVRQLPLGVGMGAEVEDSPFFRSHFIETPSENNSKTMSSEPVDN
jgi:hypothetical protein